MAFNEHFHSNITSFADCITEIKRIAASAINAANNAYDEQTFKNSINDIRQCLEAICWAIICDKEPTFAQAQTTIGNKPLATMVTTIASTSNILFDADNTKNEIIKQNFLSIKDFGNSASHVGRIAFADCENAKVKFKEIIEWFWAKFLPTESIPNDIQTTLNGTLLHPNEVEKRAALRHYYNKLKAEYQSVVMNDENGMTLQDIYIEPYIQFWEGCLAGEGRQDYRLNEREAFNSISITGLHDFVHNYFMTQTTDVLKTEIAQYTSRLLLLLGQPGQGKTSFCKRFLYEHVIPERLDENAIFYVRLRDIGSVRELFNNPLPTLQQHISQQINRNEDFLNKDIFYRAVIILDGLDELAMREGSNRNEIEDFCKDLIKAQEKHEELRIIITSRYGQVDLDKFSRHEIIVTAIGKLTENQQLEWLSKYKTFHPTFLWTEADISNINKKENSKHHHLRELIDQPILLHLIAITNIKIDDKANRAAIYDRLFSHLIQRAWDKGQIDNLRELKDPQMLRDYIREVAFAIYISDYEYIRQSDLEQLPASEDFVEALGGKANINDVLRYLMMAFYMQEVQKDKNDVDETDKRRYAVEFLHKSLQEYLVAEKIWEKIKGFADKNSRTKKYEINTAEEALVLVWELFSKKNMPHEIHNYLQEHIDNDEETDKENIFVRMFHFMPELLERQFLYKVENKEPLKAALRTFKEYWRTMLALRTDKNIISFDDVHREKFVEMIKMPQSNVFFMSIGNLSRVDLRGINMQFAFLLWINLSESNLSRANFSGANLSYANLANANLVNTHFGGIHYIVDKETHLIKTNLIGANLSGANLSYANLSGAELCYANFKNTNLHEAYLEGADLTAAKNLVVEQLKTVKSLYGTKGITLEMEDQLKAEGYKHLFETEQNKEDNEEERDGIEDAPVL